MSFAPGIPCELLRHSWTFTAKGTDIYEDQRCYEGTSLSSCEGHKAWGSESGGYLKWSVLEHILNAIKSVKENILISSLGTPLLADFGISRVFHRHQGDLRASDFEGGRCDVTNKKCGTIGYAAPEVLQGLKYSYPADIFSLGVVMKELLEGHSPFHGNGEDNDEIIRKTLSQKAPTRITPHFDIIALHLSSAVSYLLILRGSIAN